MPEVYIGLGSLLCSGVLLANEAHLTLRFEFSHVICCIMDIHVQMINTCVMHAFNLITR